MAVLETAPSIATYHPAEWAVGDLVAAKGRSRIVVCIPARDEIRTIGAIVSCIHRHLVEAAGLVDEIVVVVDDGSRGRHGRRGPPPWRRRHGQAGARRGRCHSGGQGPGDYVVYLDGDVENFATHYVTGLLGPMLCGTGRLLVKGSDTRPLGEPRPGAGA